MRYSSLLNYQEGKDNWEGELERCLGKFRREKERRGFERSRSFSGYEETKGEWKRDVWEQVEGTFANWRNISISRATR